MYYGIDIGGTKIELAIFDKELALKDVWRIETERNNYALLLSNLCNMVNEADAKSKCTGSLGIGLPGFVDSQGLVNAGNISCLSGKNLEADLSKALHRPVTLENDVNTLILSEQTGGAADGKDHAVGLILGTGVACGLLLNGKIYRGQHGNAGEFGHSPLAASVLQKYDLPLRQCSCGLTGCAEQYLAGPGLLKLCQHLGCDYSQAEQLSSGLAQQDDTAQHAFHAYLECLASFLAQVTLMLNPETIVLGGGVSKLSAIYPLAREAMSAFLPSSIQAPSVLPAFFGDSSGVRGAAILGSQTLDH